MRGFGNSLIGLIMTASAVMSCLFVVSRPMEAEPEVLQQKPLRARLIFAGDLMQHLPQVQAARSGNSFDYSKSFAAVAPYFEQSDLACINLETTLTPTAPYTGYPCFRSPTALATALKYMGIDVAVLANNHCCDGGTAGVEHTISALTANGISHTGVFADQADYAKNNILYLQRGGIRFALVNYTYGTNGIPIPKGRIVHLIDTLHIAADLARIPKDSADCIIACVHWGVEYQRKENADQRALAAFLHRKGVDLIIGSHPHVVQPFEADGRSVTIYSLGNFVSNQRKRYSDGGLMVSIVATKELDGQMDYTVDLIPVWVSLPGYFVVTPESADSLSRESRIRYDQFVSDTEQTLFAADSYFSKQ